MQQKKPQQTQWVILVKKCSGRHSWLIRNYNIQWQKLCPLIVLSKICQTTQEPVISNRVHHTVYSKLLSRSATHEEKVGFLWDRVKKSYIYKYCKQQHAQGISSNCENKLHSTLMNSVGSVSVANAKLQLETKSFRVAAETLTCKVSCSPACYTFYVDCICIAYRPTNRAKVLKQPCLHEINSEDIADITDICKHWLWTYFICFRKQYHNQCHHSDAVTACKTIFNFTDGFGMAMQSTWVICLWSLQCSLCAPEATLSHSPRHLWSVCCTLQYVPKHQMTYTRNIL